jgi:hypothetical protein
VQFGRKRAEFPHIAEHRDPPQARPFRQSLQRRPHRWRRGVIAFIDQQGGTAGDRNLARRPPTGPWRILRQRRHRSRNIQPEGCDHRQGAAGDDRFLQAKRTSLTRDCDETDTAAGQSCDGVDNKRLIKGER